MKDIKFLPISVSFVLVLALAGCGGSGSSSDSVTISGKAIDPYLSGAEVYLDLNENRKLDSNEPSTVTDENGDYTLNIPKEYHESYHTLVVTNGIDTGTQKPFKGTLTAIKDINESSQNITPLTSVVEAKYHQDKQHKRLDEIVNEVASYLELSEDQIEADIVALSNRGEHKPLKTALALQASAEKHYDEHPYEFYKNIAEKSFLDGYDWKSDLKTSDPTSYEIVTKIMDTDVGDHKADDFAKYVYDEVHTEVVPSKWSPFGR